MKVGEREPGVEMGARERLALVFEWYRGMISPETGRLVYLHDPSRNAWVVDGEPIREIAAVADVARLSRFLGRAELHPLVKRSISHWEAMLTADGDALRFDGAALGRPPTIAHSAFLILGILEAGLPGKLDEVRRLAEGILRQQRPDGSLRVHFEDRPDEGLEFYPGEALLALLRVHAECLEAAEHGFAYARARYARLGVAPHLLVFHANWQSQYGAQLYRQTAADAVRSRVRDHLLALHDRILAGGFYDEVAAEPRWQATVEVACGLEGLVEAQVLAFRGGDRARADRYGEAARAASGFLFRTQRVRHCTARERGGFGQSLHDDTQRIDVTGHAADGLMKAVTAGLL